MDGESRDTQVTPGGDADGPAFGRAVMAAVGDGVFQADGDGRIVAVNDAFLDATGFDRDALVGEPVSALLGDDAAAGRAVLEALLSGDGGDSDTVETTVATADGHRDAELHVRAVTNGDGTAGVVGTLRDAGESDQGDDTGDGKEPAGEGDDRDGDDTVYQRLLAHLPGVAFRHRNERGWPMEYVSDGCTDLTGYDAERVASGEVSWGDDVVHPEDRDDLWSEIQAAVDDGREYEVTYRIRTADGDTRWVWEQGRAVDDGDGEMIEGFLSDVTDRRRTQRKLERERDLNDRVLASSPVGIAVMRPDGSPERANDRMEELLGIVDEPTTDLSQEYMTVYDADGDPVPPSEFPSSRVFETGEPVYDWEAQVEYDDGERRWVSASAVPLEADGGDVERAIVTAEDVTDRVEREQQLRRERERFRSMVREVKDYAIFRMDADGHIESWNEGAERIKGYDREEILGEHFSRFYTEKAREAGVPEENLRRAAEQGRTEDEGWRVRADGSRFWANVTITALYDDDGEVRGFTKVTRDMTDRREREQALRRERDLVERIVEASPVGIALLEPDGSMIRANERAEELLGLSADELADQTADERAIYDADGDPVPADERPFAEVLRTGEPVYDRELQIAQPDGERRWVSVNCTPLSDDDGVERVLAVGEDVTDLKEAQRALARERDELEAELSELFGRVTDAFFALDDDWEFTYLNERAEELLDRSEAELLGENIWEEFGDAAGTEFQVQYERAMERQEAVHFEAYYPPLDAWFSVSAYPSETGLSVYFRDVTERKQYEQALAGLHDVTRELPHAETDAEVAERVVAAATDVLDLPGVAVYLHDEDADDLYPTAYSESLADLGLDLSRLPATADSSLTAKAFVEGETLAFEDVQEADLAVEESADLRRNLFIPIGDHGVLGVGDDQVGGFDERTVELAELLAANAESVLDRVARERELRRKERRFQAVFEDPNILVGLLEPDGTVLDINGTAMEYIDADLADVTGEPFWETPWWGEGDGVGDDVREWVERAAAGEYVEFEADLTRPDGDRYTLSGFFRPVTDDDGDVVSIIVSDRDITERREYQRQLEESERRYRTLAEYFPNGVVTLFDHDLEYTLAAGQAFDYLPVEPDEVEGHSFREVWGEETANDLEPIFEAALAGEERLVELSYAGRDWVVHGVPITDERGDVFAGMTMAQDITERKRFEDAIRNLHDTTRELFLAESGEEVADLVVSAASDVLGLSDSALYLRDDERGDLYAAAKATGVGVMWDDLPRVTPGDDTIVGHVYETGESVRWDDIRDAPQFIGEDTEMRAGVYAPVGEHGAVFAGSDEIGAFDDRTLQLLELLAANAEAAFDRLARERELEESERRYRTLAEQFPDGAVGIYDDDLRYELVAGPVLPDLGLDADEMEGRTIHEVFPAETASQLEPLFDDAFDGRTQSKEIEFAGHVVQVWATPVRDEDGEVFAGLSFAQDVTERVARERQLEESERRYRTLAEQFPNGLVTMYDDDLRYTVAGGEAFEHFEFSASEMEGSTVTDLFDGEVAETLTREYRAALDGESRSFEVEYAGREWHVRTTPLRDEDGEVFAGLAMGQDVTERKQRERALELYETIVETVDDGVYVLDEEFEFTMVNDAYCEMTGYDRDELLGAHSTLVVGDDVAEESADLLAELSDDGSATLEADILRADGTRLPAESNFTALPSPDSESPWKVGVVRDVSERVERERELERYETIVETVNDGICMLDANCRFTMVNDAFADILAMDRDDLIGRTVAEVLPDSATATAADLREALVESAGDDVFELDIVNEAGEECVLDLRASVLDGDDGVESIIGVVRDVTDRKARERELERTLDLLEKTERTANVGGWELDVETMDVFWSDHLFDILGVSGGEEPPLEEALEVYHEDDRPVVEAAIEDAIDEAESFDVEARIRTPDGELRWLRIQGAPETDGDEVVALRGAAQDVTDRKARERELEQFHAVAHAASDAIVTVDESNTIQSANPAVADVFGYDPDEVVGEPLTTLMSEEMAGRHLDGFQEYLRSDEQTLEWDYMELPGRRADGGEVPLAVSFSEYEHDGERFFAGIMRDIADRKERERELERYETLVETIWDGVYALDDDGEFVMVNDAFCDLVGWEREDLLGEPADVVHTGNTGETAARMAESVLAGERDIAVLEHEVRTRDGGTVPVESRFGPYPYDDDSYGRCGVVRDVTDRLERERELRARMRQQQVTAELGRVALEEPDLDRLFAEATEWVAATLGTDYCKVLDLDEDAGELLLRQGVGWQDGYVGEATVAADENSQAGFTLESDEPVVVVEDLDSEERFSGPDLLLDHDVQSGMSVVIGSESEPWGILGTHDTDRREFSEHDVNFLESVANVLATAVARHRRMKEIERQRQHLEALNNLNGVVQDINEALAESSTRQEIERAVCERLVEAEDYALAWIGEVNRNTREVTPSVWAGEGDGYLDEIDVTVDDSETGLGPTGRAVESLEMQTTADFSKDDMEPWREVARDYGFESSAAIPLVYEGTLYGVLNVYATRPAAFEGSEGGVISQLGGVVGHAIRSVERKEALMSEHVVELEFRSRAAAEPFTGSLPADAEVTFERTVPTDEAGRFLQYAAVTGATEDEFRAAAEDADVVTDVRLLSERGDSLMFELATEDPPITSRIASHGGRVSDAAIEDGELRVVAEIPHSVEVRSVVSALSEVAPDLELVSQRSTQRDEGLPRGRSAMESLTDKQLAAVEAAFYAGYFDWPRESTAEDLAESMGVSAPTLHQHLRKGERKLLAGYFEG